VKYQALVSWRITPYQHNNWRLGAAGKSISGAAANPWRGVRRYRP
jgi:hypothetical protein